MLSSVSNPRGRGCPGTHFLSAYFKKPSTRTAKRTAYRISGPDDDLEEYRPTSMSSALSRIRRIELVKTSGDLAISLNRVPCDVARIASRRSISTIGTSLMKSVKSAGFHRPGSKSAASTINCSDLVLSAVNRVGSPLAKKSSISGIRIYGTVKNWMKRSESEGVKTLPNVGSSLFSRCRTSSSLTTETGFVLQKNGAMRQRQNPLATFSFQMVLTSS